MFDRALILSTGQTQPPAAAYEEAGAEAEAPRRRKKKSRRGDAKDGAPAPESTPPTMQIETYSSSGGGYLPPVTLPGVSVRKFSFICLLLFLIESCLLGFDDTRNVQMLLQVKSIFCENVVAVMIEDNVPMQGDMETITKRLEDILKVKMILDFKNQNRKSPTMFYMCALLHLRVKTMKLSFLFACCFRGYPLENLVIGMSQAVFGVNLNFKDIWSYIFFLHN